MAEGIAGLEGTIKKLPWWVFPIAGGGVIAVVLVMKRGGSKTVTAVEQGTPTDSQTSGSSSDSSGSSNDANFANLDNVISNAAASDHADAANIQAAVQQLHLDVGNVIGTLSSQSQQTTSDTTSGNSSKTTATTSRSKPKHHIDSSDKAKHRKRQEKKGQVGHK